MEEANVDYWSLSPDELAARLALLARSNSFDLRPGTREEARRLAEQWQEAIALPEKTFSEQQRRASSLDSLQKRTIEILIRSTAAG